LTELKEETEDVKKKYIYLCGEERGSEEV